MIGLTYSVSPVHTDAYYGERAAAMQACPDVDRLYLKDPGGLVTVDRLRELAPLFGPAEFHSHQTIGLAGQAYVEAARLGFTALHTAVAPLANGTSQPAAETTLRNLAATGFAHDLDSRRWPSCPPTSARSRWRRACRDRQALKAAPGR